MIPSYIRTLHHYEKFLAPYKINGKNTFFYQGSSTLTLPRDTFIFIRTFNAEKAGSKSVEMHITGIKLQAGIVFVSQLLYL
jgi:hypothetical protein